jgi:hypothetical protein
MRWKLQRYKRDGGISGEGVKNLLEASGFKTREDLIIREALQNSVDAHDDVKGHKVRVMFRKVSLTGKKKKEFVALLALSELAEIGPLLKATPQDSPLRGLDDKSPLKLLYIEDFNTKGLGGGLDDLRGNYYRLLFLVGDAMKAETDDDLGGSYGFGKSVYASNSSSSTIVAFSAFGADSKTGNHHARLLGSTFQKAYTQGGKDYTGRGWFGGENEEEGVPDPIINADAIKLAEKLGFSKRQKSDPGTSILLIGTETTQGDLTIERIRESIETWWWPRYIEDRLDIELYEDETKREPPRPKKRTDLVDYIDCYLQMANGGSSDVRVTKFNAHSPTGFQMGSIALKAVSEDAFASRVSDDPGPGARRVAMMRGPMMVVDYHQFGTERREPFVGVYKAPSDINTHLRLSEPKEHHRWDENARRLQAKPHGNDVVESVIRRCSVQVRDFQASLAPKKEQPKDRLDAMDRLLGNAFAKPGGTREAKPPRYGKAFIEFPNGVERLEEASGTRVSAEIRLRLKPDVASPQELTVSSQVFILQDASRTKGQEAEDALPVDIYEMPSKKKLASGVAPQVKVELFKDQWTTLRVLSAEYSPDWVTELEVTVD